MEKIKAVWHSYAWSFLKRKRIRHRNPFPLQLHDITSLENACGYLLSEMRSSMGV